MANSLIYCFTKIENVLIWQMDLDSIPCTSGATYIAKTTKRQSNTDTIPSTQESKLLDHTLPSTSTTVLSYKQEIPSLELRFLFCFLQHCSPSLGILAEGITLGSYFPFLLYIWYPSILWPWLLVATRAILDTSVLIYETVNEI